MLTNRTPACDVTHALGHAEPHPAGDGIVDHDPLGHGAGARAYDAERHNVVLFGGVAGQAQLGDTWTWTGSAWSHRQGLTANPPAREGAAMACDVLDPASIAGRAPASISR